MKFVKKNFDDLYLVELEHKYIHLDCAIVTMVFGTIFALIVGPWLEPHNPTSAVLKLIAFTFAFTSLFWAWRIAVYLRRKANHKIMKWKIRKSFHDGSK